MDTNGAVATEKAEIEDAIPIEALEGVDLTMPEDNTVELMASEMVKHLQEYHQLTTLQRAARQAEDHQRAEQLSKAILTAKMAVAVIQHKYPKAKAIADEIMRTNAAQVARSRSAIARALKA